MSTRPYRRIIAVALLYGAAAFGAPRRLTAQTTPPAATGPAIAPAPGVDPAFDERAKAISSRLRCPVCQGESIQDSPAELSTQMKSLVREQLASGRTEEQVFDYFIGKYGQWILLEPRAEGINLLVYGLPILFLVGGGALLWVAVTRWTRPVGAGSDVGRDDGRGDEPDA